MSFTLRFAWPLALWGLLLIPLALAAYLAVQRRRTQYTARFANRNLLPNLVPLAPGWRRHAPIALYLLALSGLLAALARPQVAMAVPREEATVVLVMDTSVSMGATDVQPTRLAAANASAKRFVDALPASLRVSVVSFSNSPQLQTVPTTDRAAVRQALDALRAGGGTAMGDAIRLAVGVAESTRETESDGAGAAARTTSPAAPAAAAPPRTAATPAAPAPSAPRPGAAPAAQNSSPPPAAILLLSDGANTAGQTQPLDAAVEAQRLGIPVYTIALGTATGTIENPERPGSGQLMAVPPDDATLQRVAQITGGQFFRAPTATDLQTVYQRIGSRVGYASQDQEVTFAFVAAGAALLAAGGALALLWFNRFP
jgi:Ca-activated chloride channel family protein